MGSDIKVFSEIDYTEVKGGSKLGSEYPAWYHDAMVDEIREGIRTDELVLERGSVPHDRRHDVKERIRKNKEKLEKIQESSPDLDDKQKDYVNKVRVELGKEISRMMFTRSQMQKGLADSHMEARRMKDPSIPVSGAIHDMAQACNVPITNGKISRSGAEKVWKICSKKLGEISNTELLRKD